MVSSRRYRWFVASVVAAGLVGGCYAWYRYEFPFGPSHCCDSLLYFALSEYADAHGGNFPAGEATPEASLSLIHPMCAADLLCGKSGSESLTQAVLDRGELLGPDTCGWNYIEGLRSDDDSRLALLWDKEGLDHNGKWLSGGGHIVMLISGHSEHVPAAKWDELLAEQKVLFAQRENAPKDIDQSLDP